MNRVLDGCSVCGHSPPIKMVRQGELMCFPCFVKQYPDEVKQVIGWMEYFYSGGLPAWGNQVCKSVK